MYEELRPTCEQRLERGARIALLAYSRWPRTLLHYFPRPQYLTKMRQLFHDIKYTNGLDECDWLAVLV